MRICEIEKPKTPEQQRIVQLQANSKRASNAVKQERNRQKLQKAQKAINNYNINIVVANVLHTR